MNETSGEFSLMRSVWEELAAVQTRNGDWNFNDERGKNVFEKNFIWTRDFNEDFATVEFRQDDWNFIDEKVCWQNPL